MIYKHSCVVDAQGYYDNHFVLVTSETGDYSDAHIHSYTLKEGEQLLDAKSPAGQFARPRWNGSEWTEGGTAEEITAWEAAKPVPMEPQPTETELLAVEITTAMAAMQEQTDMAIAELTMAIAAGQEEVNPDV